MKKVFLTCAVFAALAISSCKDKVSNESETSTETITEEVTTTETTSSETGVPSFGDADVQDYVDTYESYIEEYKKAVESKDMSAFSNLATKGQELATKAQEVSGKVSGADAEKLTAYMTTKSKELEELTSKMMQ